MDLDFVLHNTPLCSSKATVALYNKVLLSEAYTGHFTDIPVRITHPAQQMHDNVKLWLSEWQAVQDGVDGEIQLTSPNEGFKAHTLPQSRVERGIG